MKNRIQWTIVFAILIGLALPLTVLESDVWADAPFDDLTSNEYTFTGRRGATFTATWDPSTYEITIATPDGTFPWDWTAFVNSNGALALAGHPDVAETFRFSDPDSLLGLETGDVMRIKAWDIISLAHLTKIGLVIGTGPSAQRAYLSEGTISHYVLAPHYIGYEVSVLGRTVTVRLSHIAPDTLEAVGVIEVQVDNPTNAYILVASDLEPRTRYQQAVEYRSNGDTLLSFQSGEQAIRGSGGDGTEVFFYAGSPLSSWSARNRSFDDVLNADTLDQSVLGGQSDGRAALKVVAQPVQHFYIGNVILGSNDRDDPSSLINALRDARLFDLNQLPTLDAPDLPAFKFVLMLSNLFGTYLINPEGRIHYTDKAFPYTADGVAPLTEIPELLPNAWLDAYRDYLDYIAQHRYYYPSDGVYWWRADADGNPPLPSWYGRNIPDIFYRNRNNAVTHRFQYSDLYSTALYLIALDDYYLATGNDAFIQTQESAIRDTVAALQAFDTAYGTDGHLFPHLVVPMGDLARIEGVYPAESAYTIYAYERAAHLYQVLGDDSSADNLLDNYVTPMRADYDATFWYGASDFFLPRRDNRSQTGSGDYFHDLWTQTMLPPLRGDIGDNRLPNLLNTFTRTEFYDTDLNYRWLSTDSENYQSDSWFVAGYTMEGGFFNGVPNVLPAVGSYQLDQDAQADQYANDFYFDVWTRMGPYETMREWDTTPAGMYLETSIYIESLVGTWWLFEEAMGLSVDGITVTVEPRLGGQFVARNVRVTADGLSAVFNYARDGAGREHIQVLSNEGLVFVVPNAVLPHHFAFDTISSPQTAGQPFQITITAQDEYNSTVTDYIVPAILADTTGTVSPTVTSNFTAGVWTGDVAITRAQADIALTAQQCNVTSTSNSFVVEPDVLHHFAFTEVNSPQTAGQPFQVTVTAQDAYGNTVTDYSGPATLMDTTGTLSPVTTGSFTDGIWTGNVTITQAQSDVTLTVQDGGITGQSNDFDVQPGALHHFVFATVGSLQTAGQPFQVTIIARDAYDNAITTYNGPAALSDTTGTISPLTTGNFTGGAWTGNVAITQAQANVTIIAQDGSATGESNSFQVQPASLHHFNFGEIGSLQTAGQPFQVTITAQDEYDNTVTGYTGSATLTDTTGTISPTITANFANGIWTGNVTITQTQNNITITAQDGSITGISNGFDIQSEALDHFILAEVGTPQTAGQPFSVTITAKDRHGNTVTAYTGPATLIDTTGTISPTIMGGFAGGVWTGDVTIIRAQINVTITAQDSSATGASNGFDVQPGTLDHFTFAEVGSPQTAGQPFQVTIIAQDEYSNTVTDYVGSATLTDTTGTISPTLTGNFSAGIWTGDVTITQAQSDVVLTAQDGNATGDSNEFDVGAGTLHHFAFAAISSPQTAGQPFQVTITAQDVYSNTVTDYTGPVTLTDTTGTIAPTVTGGFTDGTWTGDVTITQAWDNVTITAQDGSVEGKSDGFDVEPRVVHHFVFAAISSPQTAGQPFQVTITARDEYSNTAASYTGSATLTDATATISPAITGGFTSGVWRGEVTIARAQESVTITVQGNGATGESNEFDVEPGPLHHFSFAAISSPQTAGQPFQVTITAQDAHDNTTTDYAGSATLTDTTGTISPTVTGSFVGGIWGGDVTITQAQEDVTITAQDGSAVGDSDGFTVAAASLDHIAILPAYAAITAGEAYTYTAEAFDTYHNRLGDVTTATTFVLSPSASGECNENVCTSQIAGTWTVTATYTSKVATATLLVNAGALDRIAICTDPGGQDPVGDHVMTTDDTFTLYAVGYDIAGNLIANQAVTWGSTGTLDPVSDSGASTTFSPAMANTSGVIVADAGDGITDTTGTITVNPGALHAILIRDDVGGGGDAVLSHTVTVGSEFTVYAAGYDADENYISDVIASWSTTGDLDPISTGPAASAVFAPATAKTTGTIIANDGSGHTGTTGIITVVAQEEDSLLFLPCVTRAAR